MTITDVKVRKPTDEKRMKAVVSVTFDGQLVVHDTKVIAGTDKLFVAMPSRKISEGKYVDISHPITSEFRQVLEEAILSAYEKALLEQDVQTDAAETAE